MVPYKSPVKVVHLITLLELGGAQGNTIYTVKNLNPQKFEAHLWSGKGAYWDKNVQSTLGFNNRLRFFPLLVRNLNPFFDAIVLIQLWRSFRRLKPTILHTHSSKAGILGRWAGRLAGVPFIIHSFHGFGFNNEQKPWTRWFFVILEKISAPLAHRLIFVSHANIETAKAFRIGRPPQYALIRSGVSIQTIREGAQTISPEIIKKEFGIPPDAKMVITIGALKPQKNLFDFLAAAKKISERAPETHFVILGDGTLRPALEKRIDELGIKHIVHMPGWREDATQILALSHVFVMTSLWEGLPRTLVEAMILGVPSVCYATDGVRDLLANQEGGLVPQHDVSSMADRVVRLLINKNYWRRVSNTVKNLVGPEFSIDEMVRQQENLYTALLEVDKPPRIH